MEAYRKHNGRITEGKHDTPAMALAFLGEALGTMGLGHSLVKLSVTTPTFGKEIPLRILDGTEGLRKRKRAEQVNPERGTVLGSSTFRSPCSNLQQHATFPRIMEG